MKQLIKKLLNITLIEDTINELIYASVRHDKYFKDIKEQTLALEKHLGVKFVEKTEKIIKEEGKYKKNK